MASRLYSLSRLGLSRPSESERAEPRRAATFFNGFLIKRGVILQGIELVVTAILSFTSGGFHISTESSYPGSAGTSVLVCGQSTVIFNSF